MKSSPKLQQEVIDVPCRKDIQDSFWCWTWLLRMIAFSRREACGKDFETLCNTDLQSSDLFSAERKKIKTELMYFVFVVCGLSHRENATSILTMLDWIVEETSRETTPWPTKLYAGCGKQLHPETETCYWRNLLVPENSLMPCQTGHLQLGIWGVA